MTSQLQDTLIYENEQYQVIGVSDKGLPSPLDFGMKPAGFGSHCFRGYSNEYSCTEGKLVLIGMMVRVVDAIYPEIGGVCPAPVYMTRTGEEIAVTDETVAKDRGWRYVAHQYTNLRVTIAYSGGLLAGKGLIIRAWESPLAYETVSEFLIDDGVIRTVIDYSESVQRAREETSGGAKQEDVFMSSFSLVYNHRYTLSGTWASTD